MFLSSCLSLRLALKLPKKQGTVGTLELEYKISERLQNISNYEAPRDDIAPLPLPLWEWDFRAIAAQSEGIELQSYRFKQAKKRGKRGVVKVALSFRSEEDLQLLLGDEVEWDEAGFRWQLSAVEAEAADSSYPALDGKLSSEEREVLQNMFAGETLDLEINGQKQSLAMADFLTGTKNIDLVSN